MNKLKKITGFFLVVLLATQGAQGQLLKVDQTVFGMDCAPCAHGVQEGLKKMPGIADAKVSLNEGKAFITLKPVNRVTLSAIRKNIINNGFSPRDAEVVLKGFLKKINGLWAIQVQDEVFRIDDHSRQTVMNKLNQLGVGKEVKLAGHVKNLFPKQQASVWKIIVRKIW